MPRQSPHPLQWVTAFALIVIAVALVLRLDDPLNRAAYGQATASGGSRGVFAFSGQLSRDAYGVFLVDVDAMTLWVYEYQSAKACLKLAAARTWRYDRYLKNYNTDCGPSPYDIEQMVEDERKLELQKSEQQTP